LFKGLFGVKLKANYKISSERNSGQATATRAGDDGSGLFDVGCRPINLYRSVWFMCVVVSGKSQFSQAIHPGSGDGEGKGTGGFVLLRRRRRQRHPNL